MIQEFEIKTVFAVHQLTVDGQVYLLANPTPILLHGID